MPWKIEYLPLTNVVAISAAGEVSNEDAGAQVVEALRLLDHHQATLVIVDYAEALSEVSLPSLHGLPDLFSRHGGLWNVRIAVVMPRSRYRIESYQFFELVCKNAGYNVKLLNTREAAEEWLAEARPRPARTDSHSEADAECVAKTA